MDNRKFESGASGSAPSAPPSPSSGYPTNGNPSGGIEATTPGAYWFHQIGEELRAIQAAAGITPDSSALNQIKQSLDVLYSAARSVRGLRSRQVITYTGVSAVVTYSADELVVENSSGKCITLSALNISASSGNASGAANSLDAGSWAYSTFYYLFVIYNPTTATAALLWSSSAVSPVLPSGYSFFARVGANKTQSATNYWFLGGVQFDRRFQFRPAAASNLTSLPVIASGVQGSPSTPTWVASSVVAFVPASASRIALSLGCGSAGASAGAAPNNAYGAFTANGTQPPLVINTSAMAACVTGELALESTNVYYYSANSAVALCCIGWEDNL